MPGAERRRQRRHHAEHGRNRRNPDLAGELVLEAVDLLAHGAGIGDDAPRPVQCPFAFRREPLGARTALDQHYAEHLLKLFQPGRHGWLGDAARLRRPSEVPLVGERQEEFKLVDQPRGSFGSSLLP
jgi:hypothetical protein